MYDLGRIVYTPVPDPLVLYLQKRVDVTQPIPKDLHYYLTVTFNLKATDQVSISSETKAIAPGNVVNTFIAQATSGATVVTPTSIQVSP